MRLVMIFFVVFAMAASSPLFAAEDSRGKAGQKSEAEMKAEDNIFSGIDPKLTGEALRSAIVKVVSRALKFGMEPAKILAMATANPLVDEGVDTKKVVVTTLATMFASQWLSDDEVYRIAEKLLVSERWVRQARQMAEQGYITPFIGTFPSVPYSSEGRDNIPPPEIPRGEETGDGDGDGEPSETPASPALFR